MEYLFITGTYRSGTTLMDKLLTSHPQGFVASQPFPYLYYFFKELFNEELGISSLPYPINPSFPSKYNPSDFQVFLSGRDISKSTIEKVLNRMKGYSGCGTPEVYDLAGKLGGGDFMDTYKELCNALASNIQDEVPDFIGTKEIIGEDFIPGFLNQGVKTILLIRDPRDIILSANFSANKTYMGESRPILYTLQLWRKSVAYAAEFGERPGLLVIRYEDLVLNSFETLDKIARFMGTNSFDRELFQSGIHNQYGEIWKGNSAFGDYQLIETSSAGGYKSKLNQDIVNYINTICGPEMKLMGYRNEIVFNEENVKSFREPDYKVNDHFNPGYSSSETSVKNEIERYNLLANGSNDPEEIINYFLFESTYQKLKLQLET